MSHTSVVEVQAEGFTDLDSFAKVDASTDAARLYDLAALCSVEPAQTDRCLPCRAYVRAGELDDQASRVLNTVHDHPAVLLLAAGETDLASSVARDAATILRDYEASHSVTFAALDNDALAEVRKAYDLLIGGGSKNEGLIMADLVNGIRDLLGLDPP